MTPFAFSLSTAHLPSRREHEARDAVVARRRIAFAARGVERRRATTYETILPARCAHAVASRRALSAGAAARAAPATAEPDPACRNAQSARRRTTRSCDRPHRCRPRRPAVLSSPRFPRASRGAASVVTTRAVAVHSCSCRTERSTPAPGTRTASASPSRGGTSRPARHPRRRSSPARRRCASHRPCASMRASWPVRVVLEQRLLVAGSRAGSRRCASSSSCPR